MRGIAGTRNERDAGPLEGDARRQALVEEFGYSEEIAELLPADEPVAP